MLDICDVFSKEYFVKYNVSKIVAICYGKVAFMLNWAENPSDRYALTESAYAGKHLWNIWGISIVPLTNCDDIKYKKRIFITSVNKLSCPFSFASSSIRAKLLKTYCSAWYWSQNWQPDTEAVRGFHTEWNKAIRTLGLPLCTRSKLLPHLAGYQSSESSENDKILYIGKRSADNAIGCLGKNRIHILNKFDRNPIYCKLPRLYSE